MSARLRGAGIRQFGKDDILSVLLDALAHWLSSTAVAAAPAATFGRKRLYLKGPSACSCCHLLIGMILLDESSTTVSVSCSITRLPAPPVSCTLFVRFLH